MNPNLLFNMYDYKRWDIVYSLRYPEDIKCSKCNNYFSITPLQQCPHNGCTNKENISHIIAKPRPCIIWIDKSRWFKNMAFAIPTSTSPKYLHSDAFNVLVKTNQTTYFPGKEKYVMPFRAVIYQATRVDGSAFSEHDLIGKITDTKIQEEIEKKLINWLFYNWVQ